MAQRAGRRRVARVGADVRALRPATAPTLSATLAIHEEVKRRVEAGEDVLHLGFGEAGLPVHPLLRNALASASADGSYGPVAGDANLRLAVAGFYVRRGLDTDASQIVV